MRSLTVFGFPQPGGLSAPADGAVAILDGAGGRGAAGRQPAVPPGATHVAAASGRCSQHGTPLRRRRAPAAGHLREGAGAGM